ncbi:MAG: C10 family peptidase [Prevotellaceae bacterium]|jgi:hypothetical protein|nr:C10 family peptidase [Prevotellaceae bacterium]
MIKKTLLIILLLVAAWTANAVQRSSQEALAIARAFFARSEQTTTRGAVDNMIRPVISSRELLKAGDADTRHVVNGDAAFYVYNRGDDGYVIISGDDSMKPILGYSLTNAFVVDGLPDNLLQWLQLYQEYYEQITDRKGYIRTDKQSLTAASYPSTVAPLLGDINYNQDAPYWNDCPLLNGRNTYSGCVATAMATIMRYYQYPTRGIGSHSYTWKDKECAFNFGSTVFDWTNMLPQYYPGQYTTTQGKAISTLMYACGVAVNMNYDTGGSGASAMTVAQAVVDYFGYDSNSMGYAERACFTSAEWIDKIKNELASNRPIFYAGSSLDVGHAFVFDGYDEQNMVHVNWGWGGANNGYFEVASLDPDNPGIGGGTATGGGYVFNQCMVTGWQPPTEGSVYASYFQVDSIAASKSEVLKGSEQFNVTVYNIYNYTTTFKGGELALLVDKEGQRQVLATRTLSELKSLYGYSRASFTNLIIPADMADGVYTLSLATKEQRETDWTDVRARLGYNAQLRMTIAGDRCTFVAHTGEFNVNDLTGSVEATTTLYDGQSGKFNMTLTNQHTSIEYYGMAGVAFLSIPAEGTEEESEFVALVGYTQVEIAPSLTKNYNLSGVLEANLLGEKSLPAGEYYICPGVEWGPYIYALIDEENLVKVTVNEPRGNTTLNVLNGRLEKELITTGEQLKFLANLTVSGTGSSYSGTLTMRILPTNGMTPLSEYTQDVFVKKNVAYQLEMAFDPKVEAGNYIAALYKPALLGGYVKVVQLPFTVTVSTGIADATATEGIRLYKEPGSLRIVAEQNIRQIRIYALNGTLIYTGKPESATVTLATDRWSRGVYVIEMQTADGVWKQQKYFQ